MTAWVEGRVAGRRRWNDSLFSLQVDAPQVTFIAGQFARLALPAPPGSKEAMIGRPYSFVNPPSAQPHEFYFIILPEGPLSPRLAALDTAEGVLTGTEVVAGRPCTIAEVPGLRGGKATIRTWVDDATGCIVRMERTDDPAPLVVVDDLRVEG
jgi:ferredoxin--NADP+ reductase